MRGSLYFVEHQAHQAVVVEVVARLLSLQPSRFLTAEGALEAVERAPPHFLLTDLLLPGRDGLSLIRDTKTRSPRTSCVLLSSVPPGLPPGAEKRLGIDAVVARRGAWASRLAEHAGEIGNEEAARLIALVDRGGEAFDELAAELRGRRLSPEREALALRYVAAAFDPDQVLALLEPLHDTALELAIGLGGAGFDVVVEVTASPSAPHQLRARAMRHLARTFPHEAVVTVLQDVLRDPSPLLRLDAAHALFESASRVGELGLGTLREIADARELPDELRIDALHQIARELPRASVKEVLVRAFASDRPAVVHAASALSMKGDGVDVDALAAQAAGGPQEERIRALEALARDFPKESVLPILERSQSSSDPVIRQRAYELAMSRADTGFEPTLARAAAEGRAMLEAALLGALRLGAAGFRAVSEIARDRAAAAEVRAMAARMLGVRFGAPFSAPVLEELACGPEMEVAAAALLGAVQLGSPGFAVLKAAQISAPIPAVRELALIHLEEHAPDPVFKPALQRGLRDPDLAVRARAVELWMRRLGGEFAPLLEKLVKSGLRELQEAALDGALALGAGGFTALRAFAMHPELHAGVRKRALEALRARFPDEDLPSAPTEPAAPVEAPPAERWEIASTRPTPPAAPPPKPPDQVDLERARKALHAAILLGHHGYKAIRTLADSPRVPDEVRIQALRRLASDFPEHDVMPVLERALRDRSFQVQNVALGCAMLRKDARFEPIAALASNAEIDAALRIRAVRFLASRFEKEKVKPLFEALLEQPDERLRRAALECLFTSLKFVHPERIEEHLINLLTEHESAEVKVAACKALGAFGGQHALQALVRFTGLFADGAVKDAAKQEAARIRSRLSSHQAR